MLSPTVRRVTGAFSFLNKHSVLPFPVRTYTASLDKLYFCPCSGNRSRLLGKQLCWICIADVAVVWVNYISVTSFPGYPDG